MIRLQNYVEMLRGLDVYRYDFVGVAWTWIESLPGKDHVMAPPTIRTLFNETDLHKYLDTPPEDVRRSVVLNLSLMLTGALRYACSGGRTRPTAAPTFW